jgi:hypothetical protein
MEISSYFGGGRLKKLRNGMQITKPDHFLGVAEIASNFKDLRAIVPKMGDFRVNFSHCTYLIIFLLRE